jgi:hypothetical protein
MRDETAIADRRTRMPFFHEEQIRDIGVIDRTTKTTPAQPE